MSDGNPNDQTTVAPVEPTAQPTDPNSLFADQLAGITAPDGRQKFATPEAAIASIPHAQAHIDTQAQRIKDLEQQVEQAKGVDAILERLQTQPAPDPTAGEPLPAGVDAATIAQMLDQRLAQRDTEAVQLSNASQVLNKLAEQYGEKAESQFNEKAASIGMTPVQLSDLARTSPQAALALFDKATPAPVNPTVSSVNTTSLEAQQPTPAPQTNADLFTGGTSPAISSWRNAAPT